MNKAEYLKALKEALKGIDKDVMEEIVLDYEAHFQAGAENGKSEEQICEELGSIEDLAEEIKEAYNSQSDGKNKKSGKRYFSFDNLDGEKIGDAINSALDSAGEAISSIDVKEISHTLKSTIDHAATSLNNLADSYFKSQAADFYEYKNTDAEGTTENVSKSYGNDSENGEEEAKEDSTDAAPEETKEETTDTDSAKINLVVDSVCANVTVKKSLDGKVNISYENNGNERIKQLYEFYSYKEENTVYAGVRKAGKSVFFINFKNNPIDIQVELPDNIKDVTIKTASGNIKITDVDVERISAEAIGGDVLIHKVNAVDFLVKSSSGHIETGEVNSSDNNTTEE